MDLKEAEKMATDLLAKHNSEFGFKFDNAKKRFGLCNHKKKTISLSKHLVELNPRNIVKNTILHEIAHSLTPYHKHDVVWRKKAIDIGCDGHRCYYPDEIYMPKGRFKYKCPSCGKTVDYFKKLKRKGACRECCDVYNNGKYSEEFIFQIIKGE